MITPETCAAIYAAHREILAGEKLLADMKAERGAHRGARLAFLLFVEFQPECLDLSGHPGPLLLVSPSSIIVSTVFVICRSLILIASPESDFRLLN